MDSKTLIEFVKFINNFGYDDVQKISKGDTKDLMEKWTEKLKNPTYNSFSSFSFFLLLDNIYQQAFANYFLEKLSKAKKVHNY